MTLSSLTRQEIKAGCMPKTIAMRALTETEIDVAIGRAIRKRRRMIGLSQKALAALVGVGHQQIQKYETVTNRISASRLVTIARALSCKACDLYPAEVR